MSLSIRAYARERGVSEAAVRKAIRTGRITPRADGSIDPQTANAQWPRNSAPRVTSNPQQQHTGTAGTRSPSGHDAASREAAGKAVPSAAVQAVRETLHETQAGGTTFLQARTANEVLKAQTHKIRLARLKGELVDRAKTLAQVFQLARAERDAWLNWPTRIALALAAELQVDPHTLHLALDREVRAHLDELGSVQVRL